MGKDVPDPAGAAYESAGEDMKAADSEGLATSAEDIDREGDKDDKKIKTKAVPVITLFCKHATWREVVLMLIGFSGAMISGLMNPIFILMFGEILDDLNGDDVLGSVRPVIIIFVSAGVVGLFAGTIMSISWITAGRRLSLRIKQQYVRAILRQDIGWFDEHPAGELPGAVSAAMVNIQDGITRKVGDLIQHFTTFLGTFIVSFFTLPELAAVMLACFPFIAFSTFVIVMLVSRATGKGANHYAKAGGVANEVIAGMRTVASLTAEEKEIARYSSHLVEAEKAGILAGLQEGIGKGTLFASFFLGYALAFWYGTKLVTDDLSGGCESDCATGGEVITTIFGILIGAMSLGQMTPGLQALGKARQAAYSVFQTIDRVPDIDSASSEGGKPDVDGRLEFREVGFSYPARPDDLVFNSVSISVSPGETLALVGPSGGGKSTLTKLLLRFYDPTSGSLLLDGHDVRTLNVAYFRSKIGYVGQEPILFAGSIKDNVALGKAGATDEEIIKATKAANAHDFIKSFPKGYSTDVGTGGLQLSGGQKQRIAIARAIIKDPAILLLDEATSALDTESEKVVQQALDRLRKIHRYTTIVIAHRLSTIQDADRIAVIADKGVAELGTHSDLMSKAGMYASLCATQGAGDTREGAAKKGSPSPRRLKSPGVHLMRQKSRSVRSISSASMESLRRAGSYVVDDDQEKTEATKPEQQVYELPPQSRMWALNKPEAFYLVLGFVGALVAGSLMPVEAILIANLQNNLYGDDVDKITETGENWSLGFVALGVAALMGHTTMAYGFSVAGERLTRRLREIGFKGILRHDIGWFDDYENSVGMLTTNLEEDAAKVKFATGTNVAHKTQLTIMLLVGTLIGIITAWQIGLLAVALLPLMAMASIVQNKVMMGSFGDDDNRGGVANPGQVLGGALNGITTVTAFNMQDETALNYEKAVASTIPGERRRGYVIAVGFGYSQGVMFWVFGAIFYLGAYLVDEGELGFLEFFQAFFAVFLGAYGIGQVQSEVGSAAAARQAAGRIFRLEDDEFTIDPLSEAGAKGSSMGCAISFRQVKFAYPQRLDAQVYGSAKFPRGFELEIGAGETVALVGPSGSGKSTCIQLLLRFYDTLGGDVWLDGRNIKELNVHWLRSQMGYVGQEPVLFTGSIRENIERGKPGATMAEIEAAAKSAFAHDFITSFKEGYDTDVGEKSVLLSGGQKQRIAIARAIVSDPPILLLDEATSALDNESERQVQAALDSLQKEKRRTTLVIAHRLTTVRNADKIAVISQGGVVELGSHQELVRIPRGIYAGLYHQQTDKFTT